MTEYSDLTPEELDDLCASPHRVWKFAKTMPEHPHWYLIRNRENDKLFCRFMVHIQKHGYREYFCWMHGNQIQPECKCRKKVFTKFAYKKYAYWTIAEPIDPLLSLDDPSRKQYGEDLINRAMLNV